jgi:hypothetical protein
MRARGRLRRGTYVCARISALEAHGFLLREEGVVANIQLKPTRNRRSRCATALSGAMPPTTKFPSVAWMLARPATDLQKLLYRSIREEI